MKGSDRNISTHAHPFSNKSQKDKDDKSKQNQLSAEWMDVQDVCLGLKIAKRTLWEYRHKGILSYSKIRGKVYFNASDISEFLKRQYRNDKSDKNLRDESNGIQKF